MRINSVRIQWAVEQIPNSDTSYLMAIRREWTPGVRNCRSYHLTLDGWVQHVGYEVLDLNTVPGTHQGALDDEWWTPWITQALRTGGMSAYVAGVTANGSVEVAGAVMALGAR